MNKKFPKQHITVLFIIVSTLVTCTIKPMKRALDKTVTIHQDDSNKRQKTDNSVDPKDIFPFLLLLPELQNKIIAISDQKYKIASLNEALRERTSKNGPNSLEILLHSPLHLTPKAQMYRFVQAVSQVNINVINNLAQQGYHKNKTLIELLPRMDFKESNKNHEDYPELTEQLKKLFPSLQHENRRLSQTMTIAYANDVTQIKLIKEDINKHIQSRPTTHQIGMPLSAAIRINLPFIATYLGHVELLEYISKNLPQLLKSTTNDDCSLLHLAAIRDLPATTEFLMDNLPKDFISEQFNTNGNPFIKTICAKKYENLKIFLQKVSFNNANQQMFSGAFSSHPAFCAVELGDLTALKLIKEYGRPNALTEKTSNGYTLLHTVATVRYPSTSDSSNTIDFLLECLPVNSINEENNYGNTPLHIATIRNNIYTIKLLIARNAIIKNPESVTLAQAITDHPAFFAVNTENLDLLQFLNLFAHESLTHVTKDNASLLHLAIEREFHDIAEFLLKNISFDATLMHKGKTVLGKAIKVGNVKLVELLLKHNAYVDVSKIDKLGVLYSPLTQASYYIFDKSIYNSILAYLMNKNK